MPSYVKQIHTFVTAALQTSVFISFHELLVSRQITHSHIYTLTQSRSPFDLVPSRPTQEPLRPPGACRRRRVEAGDLEQTPRGVVGPVPGLERDAVERDLRQVRPLRDPHHRHIT